MKRYFLRFCVTLLLFVLLSVPALAYDVPVGYSILEYIQSSGTQYIDSGVVLNENIGVTTDFQLVNTSNSKILFGCQNSTSTNMFKVATSVNGFTYYYGSKYVSFNADKDSRLVVHASGQSFSSSGSTVTNTGSLSSNYPFYSIYAFALNSKGNPSSFSSYSLYSMQIYDDGTLVRDYVPVKNLSDEVGLWDKVTGQFIGNSGTGVFVAGPVVEVVAPSVPDPDNPDPDNPDPDNPDPDNPDPDNPDPDNPDPDNPDPDNPNPDIPEPPKPKPEEFDGWTPVESHYLFSGGDSWTMNLTSDRTSGDSSDHTFYGSSGSFGGEFGFINHSGIAIQDSGSIFFRASFGGILLEKGQTYRIRVESKTLNGSSFSSSVYPLLSLGDVTIISEEVTVSGATHLPTCYSDIVFVSNSDHFASMYCSTSVSKLTGNISGRIDRVQPTKSGDSFSSTTSDIENKADQINKAEEQIFTDLELYSSQVDPGNINFGTGIVNAISFIGSTWTDAFGQLGDLQAVVTFPMFLGIALLFIGRASSVIVSGSMRSKRNNDKKGGGDVG